MKLDWQAELKSVDEQADNEIVHRSGFRKTDSSSHQSFDARAQRQMFAFQLLRVAFPYFMIMGVQMSLIRPPAIGVKTCNPKRHEQRFELQKRLIFPPPKHVG